jgi:trimeric autotransporter adhesin
MAHFGTKSAPWREIEMKTLYWIALFSLSILPNASFAANCSSPTKAEGTLIYNSDRHILQYCNGTSWVAVKPTGSFYSPTVLTLDDLSDAATKYSSQYNVFIGSGAGVSTTTGLQCTAAGYQALQANNTGSDNSAIGYRALYSNQTGNQNTAIGSEALYSNVSGSDNTAAGYQALYSQTGSQATAVGYQALKNNTANGSTAMGYQAAFSNTTGAGNTAFGYQALYSNTTGNYNSAAGYQALRSLTTGSRNTAFGAQALFSSTADNDNTAIGYQALYTLNGGSANTAIGTEAGYNLTTGSNNTLIGYRAGYNLTTGSSNIIIGSGVNAPTASTSNHLNIGNLIYGDLSNKYVTIGASNPVSRFIVAPPATQTIAGGNTIAADACGTIKRITAAGAVTTSTTNTFTSSTASYNGCCMDVINVGSNAITLDFNASFKSNGGVDQVLGQYDAVRVCSNGSNWYQVSAMAVNQ